MTEKVLLTVSEAADRLSLGRSKVYELMAAGHLRSVTIGRSRRVPADALNDFVISLNQGDESLSFK